MLVIESVERPYLNINYWLATGDENKLFLRLILIIPKYTIQISPRIHRVVLIFCFVSFFGKMRIQPPDRFYVFLQARHESEKLAKRSKKDIARDECTGLYNGNGMGMYHPVSSAGSASDPYLQMQWAVFELATRGASAFRPWNSGASCKHRDR